MFRRAIIGIALALLAGCGSSAGGARRGAGAGRQAGLARRQQGGATAAPIATVPVSWGTIGYRSVGHGPPLVLLVGGGDIPAPSIDNWPPSLVNGLARSHRVLAMDYEGVGRTTLRPGKLTIDRMADDTADFIRALHLPRADVMGWSMGGFVAQALAIRHPQLVRRLVLCSTALGDGTARPATVSGEPAYPGQWLFPLNSKNRARAAAYERAIHAYPHYYGGPRQVSYAEGYTAYAWVHGGIPDGHYASRISAPTLVGGGSQDVVLPLPDSPDLARAIRHSTLTLYPDSGHGFLVQHALDWTHRVDRFLSAAG